jgi:hypothetical protein
MRCKTWCGGSGGGSPPGRKQAAAGESSGSPAVAMCAVEGAGHSVLEYGRSQGEMTGKVWDFFQRGTLQ